MITHLTDSMRLAYEDLVYEYLRLTLRKDIRHLLYLFAEDATIHEPFTKLKDRRAKVNTMILTTIIIYDLIQNRVTYEKSRIECIDCYYNKIHITCTLPTGQGIIIRFVFKFGYDRLLFNRRIKLLHIELIG